MKQTSPLRFGVGMFGGVLSASFFTAFMAFFYVDKMNLDIKIYSLALAIYSVLDAFDNPLYGYLSDRTNTRFGRRRPWLILGIVLSTISVIAFFSPPSGLSGGLFIAYFIGLMLLTETAISMIQANYGPLFPELFKTQQLRSTANSFRQAFQFIATIIAVGLSPMLSERIGFSRTALILAVVGGGIYLYSAFGCREEKQFSEIKKPLLFPSLKEILSNKKFWLMGAASTMYSTIVALIMAAIPFYIKYHLRAGGAGNSILVGVVLVTATFSLLGWNLALRKFRIVTVWRLALGIIALALIPFYFAGSLAPAIIAGAFVGIGMGGYVSTGDLVIASLIDEDMEKYGVRREGMFISILAFVNRFSGFIRSFAFLLLAILFGFKSGDEPGNSPGEAAKFLLIVVPFLLALVGFIFALFLKLKDKPKEAAPVDLIR